MTPMTLEVTLAVQRELEVRAAETDALRRKHLERTRYDAELARRRYMKVDPDNRLVADALEADRAAELAGREHLIRLWKLAGDGRVLGLWQAGNEAEMQAILKSLPLDAWMQVETTPLTRHPSDPAAGRAEAGPVS